MDPFYWSIILSSVGLIVLVLELFVPSAGFLGIVSASCIVAGVVVGFFSSTEMGVIMLLATLVVVPIILALMVRIWPHTPIGRRIMLGPLKEEDVLPKGEHYTEIKNLVGQLGIAKTKMLPSGIVMINGKKYDAFSEGMPIDQNQAIKVIAIKGNRIVVSGYDNNSEDPAEMPARDNDVLSRPIEDLGLEDLE